jgi:hypothetical protein
LARIDGPSFQTCIDVATASEIQTSGIPFAVQMPHMFGKVRPKNASKVNPHLLDAVITEAGKYMGTLNLPNKFYVKLVGVGDYDKTKGGNSFELRDRKNNPAMFWERAEKLQGILSLGDCFSMYGTPSRHIEDNGENKTVFRSIEIVENTGCSNPVAKSMDKTGLFGGTPK